MQQFLKSLVGAAGAGVVAAEFFEELLVAVDDADAAFHVRFGREASAALTGALESRSARGSGRVREAWGTSGVRVVLAEECGELDRARARARAPRAESS
jgi:hypothetical protein